MLLDSGSTNTLINKGSLPFGAIPTKGRAKQTTTTMGSFDSSSTALLEEIKFPQFGNCIIGSVKADVFDSPGCRYDIIVGRDVLLRMGISLDFQSKVTKWMGHELPMRSTMSIAMDIPSAHEIEQFYQQELEEDLLIMAELFSNEIMDRKYQAVSPEEVVQQLDHLNTQQRTRLKAVFEKYKRVFDGTLGCHPTVEIDIELVPGAQPIYQRAYPVPYQKTGTVLQRAVQHDSRQSLQKDWRIQMGLP